MVDNDNQSFFFFFFKIKIYIYFVKGFGYYREIIKCFPVMWSNKILTLKKKKKKKIKIF